MASPTLYIVYIWNNGSTVLHYLRIISSFYPVNVSNTGIDHIHFYSQYNDNGDGGLCIIPYGSFHHAGYLYIITTAGQIIAEVEQMTLMVSIKIIILIVANISSICTGFLVSINSNINCSIVDHHKVIQNDSIPSKIVAGNGSNGSTSTTNFCGKITLTFPSIQAKASSLSVSFNPVTSTIMVYQSTYYSALNAPTTGCSSCAYAQASMVSRPGFYQPSVYYPRYF
ncbi:hypothetical protein I4U23_001356 [Adineta vaga]|nr:hypothetical protein I4U23_001356 [Adineta vaga]